MALAAAKASGSNNANTNNLNMSTSMHGTNGSGSGHNSSALNGSSSQGNQGSQNNQGNQPNTGSQGAHNAHSNQGSQGHQGTPRKSTNNDSDLRTDEEVYMWVTDLVYSNNSDDSLSMLGKKREQFKDLGVVLWNSYGVMPIILQEIVKVYPLLSPPQLPVNNSNRVSNALQLLQCIASHHETQIPFLNSHMLLYLYPFLNTTSSSRPYEYLRLTSLGVIGALVKNDSPQVVTFLLSTEIIPLCLRIIETTSGISKTLALYIVLRILQDDQGLIYVCQTYERFFAVNQVLTIVVNQLVQQPQDSSLRLLKHVVMCYRRLADDERAKHSLREILPEALRNGTFTPLLREEQGTKKILNQLILSINQEM